MKTFQIDTSARIGWRTTVVTKHDLEEHTMADGTIDPGDWDFITRGVVTRLLSGGKGLEAEVRWMVSDVTGRLSDNFTMWHPITNLVPVR